MLMWYIILLVVIAATAAGLIYLSLRLSRFGFMEKFGRNRPKYRKFIGFFIVILIFTALSLTINLMNAVVCLLHFVVFWILSDLVFGLIEHLRKKRFKHYYAGICAVLLSLISLSAGWYLNHNVRATVYHLETDKKIEDLRIILFADSHIGTTFDAAGFAEHLHKMQSFNPDIILIAGDFVDDGTSRAEMTAAVRALGNVKTKYGVYFAFGNHDKGYHDPAVRGFTGEDLAAELQKNNITILEDETQLLNNMFYIAGRKDSSEILRGNPRLEMKNLIEKLDKQKFIIVLDHQPNDYKNQSETGVDLVLSGHTHGGQLFPLNKVGEWIGANDKTYGYEKRNRTNFIVTSGLSDWAIKFKTGTISEFVVIDLKSKPADKAQ